MSQETKRWVTWAGPFFMALAILMGSGVMGADPYWTSVPVFVFGVLYQARELSTVVRENKAGRSSTSMTIAGFVMGVVFAGLAALCTLPPPMQFTFILSFGLWHIACLLFKRFAAGTYSWKQHNEESFN